MPAWSYKSVFIYTALLSIVIFGGLLMWSIIGSKAEHAKYQTLFSTDNIEIRKYSPMLVAEVKTTGAREEAIKNGFRILADFIFGNNSSSAKVAMTAPVTQQNVRDKWHVRFMMPKNYTLQSLPQPKNFDIEIKEVPEKIFAIIRFSGVPTKDSLKMKLQHLEDFMSQNKIEKISEPTYAFFNPPWTLPLMRRNEIMIEIKKY